MRPVGGVLTAGVGSAGMPGLFGLLLAMEAGALPLWLAVAALELVAVAGTTTLFLLARGPARTLLARGGPRVRLTESRLAREGARRMLAEGCCPACLAAGTLGSARLRPETVR
ncbi:MAG TPA: hypothetical protein VFU54_02405 [Actinomycetota bacterium]|nr:hypothetical protein [Actinomycetota bacterium]